jgi:mono/diheme cytochrome c family protein
VGLARNTAKLLLAAAAAAIVALPVAGCGREEDDLSNGKAMFVQNCGSCHTLARAGTQGQTGPNLDAAFAQALKDGEGRETVEGVVHRQILHPRKGSVMQPGIVTGQNAEDVAAYVGYAAAKPGEDQGALAQAGLAGATSGEQIFVAAGCGGCHTFGPAGTKGNIGPSLDDLKAAAEKEGKSPEDYVRESIVDPNAVITSGFQPGVMPENFGDRLSDKQLQAVVQYLLGG